MQLHKVPGHNKRVAILIHFICPLLLDKKECADIPKTCAEERDAYI